MAEGKPSKITIQNSHSSANAKAVNKPVSTEIKNGVVSPKTEESEPGVNIGTVK